MVRRFSAFAIVATGMWIAALANAEAQQPEPNVPDLVLINGKVLTLDDRSTVTEAVAVADGKILATGTTAAMKSLSGARTRVLDVSGKTVIPGLIDTPLLEHRVSKLEGRADLATLRSEARTRVPLGRRGDAWDIAYAALYLASDDAAAVTGVIIPIDGGWCAW